MRISSLQNLFCSGVIVLMACGWAIAEPIRLTLDESDQPVSEAKIAPVQHTEPVQPIISRPFSLSLTADGEPLETSAVRQASAEEPPTPNQDTSVSVRAPEGAQVAQPAANGPLRVYGIHQEKIDNPAALQGTSRFSEPEVPLNPATKAQPPASPMADAPLSRFTQTPSAGPPAETPSPAVNTKLPPVVPLTQATKEAEAKTFSVWQILPGQTSLTEIESQWGKPAQTRRIDQDKHVRLYEQQGDFAKVEIAVEKDQIVSVFLIPAKSMSLELVEQKFDLTKIEPAAVRDPSGRHLGKIYPERGILIPQAAEGSPLEVDRIIVQTPSAESFMIRASNRSPLDFRDRLNDYQLAIAQEPYSAEAWYQTSLILHRLGRDTEAFEAARKATSGVGSSAEHRLHRTLLIVVQGNLASGIQNTQQIAEDVTVANHVRAKAHCQWGDLLQMAGPQKNREAVQHHVKAIEIASPLVNDTNQDVRRAAKQVLVDAHMALAIDIATGDWEKKEQTINQWLLRSKVYIDDMVTNEQATGELRMAWLTKSLMARSFYNAPFDPGDAIDQIIGQYRELLSKTDDPFFHRALEWETGQALSQAVFIEHARDQHDSALKLAEQAKAFLKGGLAGREVGIADHLLLGNLYFRAGAICAVQKQDHAAAVGWYEMAMNHLTDPSLQSIMLDRRGESLVSMGVSFWSVGNREQGIALTEQGKSLIEAATGQNAALQKKLIVPLDNLAEMYRELGNAQKSAQYTASAQKIRESLGDNTISR
ncbi:MULTISPECIES: tetratricopeptide repeat protein [Pirellulaceae]|nr:MULTISPECIES: tetratricopeptide repeat protein [Pirellulaceae]